MAFICTYQYHEYCLLCVYSYVHVIRMQNGDESDHEESIYEDHEVGSYRCLVNL